MPSKSKPLKKLLHFYWEICPKLNPDGRLKQEMILVWSVLSECKSDISNAIRNDLQHPNEYVCGMTLRFLCKLREPELLEPLLPSCRACLVWRPLAPSLMCRNIAIYTSVRMLFSPCIRSIIIQNILFRTRQISSLLFCKRYSFDRTVF